jgi:hypothetical protein
MSPLIRQPRSRKSALIQPETSMEVTLEQQILTELQKVSQGQDNLKGQVRDLRMSLMGKGDDGETEHGRLPIAEAQIENHEERLKVLEKAHVEYGVYGRFVTAGSAFLAGLVGFGVELLGHLFFDKK